MLHAWEKYGLIAAEDEFMQKYDRKGKFPANTHISFPHIVKGKIEFLGMVRGKDCPVYLRFYSQLCKIKPQFLKQQIVPLKSIQLLRPIIFTEGKTDWKHLEISLNKLKQQKQFMDLQLDFHKSEDSVGAPSLKSGCNEYSKLP